MKTAIVFLAKELNEGTLQFAVQIKKETDFDVFIVVDDNNTSHVLISGVRIIQMDDSTCRTTRFHGCNINANSTHIQKDVIALDKFLAYFCVVKTEYDNFWVFEDDCFIPSVKTIVHLNKQYGEADLVVPNNHKKTDNIPDWHWRSVFNKIKPPYYYSMVCAMGLSRAMLKAIEMQSQSSEGLFYQEIMFNTVAMRNGLNVVTPKELKSIVWQGEWSEGHFVMLPNNVFHPRKDIENHVHIRDTITEMIANNYVPKVKLPDFLRK